MRNLRAAPDGTRVYAVTMEEYDNDARPVVAVALAPEDGHVVWTHDFGALESSGPLAVDGEHVYLLAYATNGSMYALDAATGKPTWTQPYGQYYGWAPLVVGGRLYVNEFCGEMLALAADGTPVFLESQDSSGCDDGFFSPLYLGGAA